MAEHVRIAVWEQRVVLAETMKGLHDAERAAAGVGIVQEVR